jgi:2-polyprenyl-6-methoxyphenol hydroxylase-like FAD-dependent oxidoreductase
MCRPPPDGVAAARRGGDSAAGCTTALALAASGVPDVAVFDAGRRGTVFRIGESLPAAALPVLRRLGVIDRMTALRPLTRSGTTVLWGKDVLGYNGAVFDPAGAGWHLDRAAFDPALRDAVAARGIPICRPDRLGGIRGSVDRGHALSFDGAGDVATRLPVDASGAGAAGLRRLNVARNRVDVLLVRHAVVAVSPWEAGATRTFLEAVPYGWWYAARLPGNRMVAMLATDADSIGAAGLSLAGTDDWHAALTATRLVGPAVAAARPTGAWVTGRCAAASAVMSGVAGSDWVAVGDAAWSCDHLTSQASPRRFRTASRRPRRWRCGGAARGARRCGANRRLPSRVSPPICGCAPPSIRRRDSGPIPPSGASGASDNAPCRQEMPLSHAAGEGGERSERGDGRAPRSHHLTLSPPVRVWVLAFWAKAPL